MKKRRYAAPGGRVLATGLTVSATFGIVAGLASHQPSWTVEPSGGAPNPTNDTGESGVATPTTAASTPAPTTLVPTTVPVLEQPASTDPPRTTIVTRTVERIIQVDEAGEPIAPPATAPPPAAPRVAPTAAPASGGPAPTAPAAPAPTAAPPPPATAAPPPPTTAKPACTGSKC